jgi:hypothetical protein
VHQKAKRKVGGRKENCCSSAITSHNSRYMLRPEDRPGPLKVFFVSFSGTFSMPRSTARVRPEALPGPFGSGSQFLRLHRRPRIRNSSRARRILRWRLQNIFGFKWKCLFLSTDYFINATSLITLVVLGKMVYEKRDDS